MSSTSTNLSRSPYTLLSNHNEPKSDEEIVAHLEKLYAACHEKDKKSNIAKALGSHLKGTIDTVIRQYTNQNPSDLTNISYGRLVLRAYFEDALATISDDKVKAANTWEMMGLKIELESAIKNAKSGTEFTFSM